MILKLVKVIKIKSKNSIGLPPSTYSMICPKDLEFHSISNSVIYFFYRKGWFWLGLIFDILVLLFFDEFILLVKGGWNS